MHYKINNAYIIKFYGISQDPETKNYVMVLAYAKNGSLRNYLDTSFDKLSWNDKFENLCYIANGLGRIHEKELIHRDLHSDNILRFSNNIIFNMGGACITDVGLCKPANYDKLDNTNSNNIYGVLPYIAPEILRGQNYTKKLLIFIVLV